MKWKMLLFGLVMFEAALLALEVFWLATKPTPVGVGATVFVAVMLAVTFVNWVRVQSL